MEIKRKKKTDTSEERISEKKKLDIIAVTLIVPLGFFSIVLFLRSFGKSDLFILLSAQMLTAPLGRLDML